MEYKVRFVNPQKQYQDHKQEFLTLIDDVFSRGDLIMRRDLEEFEKRIADFVGVKYAIGVNSGTDALSMSMEAAGLKSGDEVITVGHTFLASISAICHQGATPVLVDVGEDYNLNVNLIESAITPRTKAIEPVHLNGRVCDMEKIIEIAQKYNLFIIEDAAQALGAKYNLKGEWKMAGSFGLAGCFSMYPFKTLGAFGDAGVVTTNDPDIAKKVRLLRYNGEDRETRQFYYHGYTALLDNLQAALLNLKLNYFPKWLERRKEIAQIYNLELANIKGLKIPIFKDERFSDGWQNYVIRAEKRSELINYLDEKGVETLISWPVPMYRQPVMMPNNIVLPETEKICNEVVSLPMYPELTDEEVRYVCKCAKEFYGNN